MSAQRPHWPGTALSSGLAALATWVTLLTWSGFAERSSGYLVPLLGGCLLVAVTGMLLRATRAPALLVLLGQVAVVATWLHHLWAADLAWAGWFPTGASLQQAAGTLQQSVVAAGQYAAPVPKSVTAFSPIMILLGVAVALLVDFLACGLRRAPLAGLPLLAAYTAPISILDGGVSWLTFAVAAVCFLALVAAEEAERLGRWGQQLSQQVFDSQATSVGSQAVWSSARKIGLTATGLAVVVPLLVPTLPTSIFDGHGNGPGGNGEAVGISNPIVDMKRDLTRGDDVDLVRVRTNDPDPSYLRITVLDEFDGKTWRPSGRDIPVTQRADGLVARPPGLEAGIPIRSDTATISTSASFRSRWLPVPYPVHSIQAPGDWRYDRNTLDFISAADNQTAAGLTYDVQSLHITPSAADLAGAGAAPSAVYDAGTQLPDSVPASVHKLAESVTQGANTDYDKAVRLQRWFRVAGGFRYSLQRSSGNGVDDLTHFLGTGKGSRVGYCEQFAAAMAVMSRSLKIPARVAVGFLRPDPGAEPNVWVYSAHDLHAWPELYFQGVGWVRFEPTPAARTGGAPAYTHRAALTEPALPSGTSSEALPVGRHSDRPTPAPGKQAGAASASSGSVAVRVLQGFAGSVLVLLLLALPRLLRTWRRHRRWSQAPGPAGLAEAGWAELRDSARDLGIAWDDTVTLRRRARDLTRSFGHPDGDPDALSRAAVRGVHANPDAVRALDRLVELVERARYARGASAPAASEEAVRRDTEACVAALRAGAGRRQRTRARWFPASVWGGPGAGARRRFRPVRATGAAEPGVDHAV